jgi:tetratricopeptide (TPR) repeat protein/transglutaminase-like putative cysteine protease
MRSPLGARHRRHHRSLISILLVTIACVLTDVHAGAQTPAPQPAAAREQQPFVIDEMITAYRFEDDGTGQRRHRVTVRINDQAGLAQWGTLVFAYMSAIEDVSLRQLVVEKPDGRRVETKDAPLEDVAATGQADEPFVSDWRAKKVAVPALQPGDRLHYDVVMRRSSSLIPGQFWAEHSFVRAAVTRNEVFEVDVPAARPITFRARRGAELPAESPAGRRILRWSHAQATPVDPGDSAVERDLVEDAKQGADVLISSFTTWARLGEWFSRIAAGRSQPDEAVKAKALELTRGVDGDDAKLRALFAFVSTRIRYVSLAFGMGRLEPRQAAQVLAAEYGDCKDKHVLLASLARVIGVEIHPVLIAGDVLLEERVPSPGQFDHVVSVRADGKPEGWLWMDTTTGLLPPGALLAPLRDRKALLARAGGGGGSAVVTSPATLPFHSGEAIEMRGQLALDGSASTSSVRRVTGDAEFGLRVALRDMTKANLAKVAEGVAREDGIRNPTVIAADFADGGPGRGVTFTYEVSHKYTLPAGKPWEMWVPTAEVNVLEASEDWDRELGEPRETTLTVRYEMPAGIAARPPVPVTLHRPFARYSSSYRVEGRMLVIERRLQTLARTIASTDLDVYRAFRKAVDADYRQTFAVDALPAAESTGSSADDLNAAGYAAVNAGEHAKAIELLQRAVQADPKHKAAWNNLGRAYIGRRDYERAVEALEKQIAVNPYDEHAYANLGYVRRMQDRLDDAIAQFRKQIEVAPLDAYSHAQLGYIHAARQRYDEAEQWLDKAVRLGPKDAGLWLELGRTRLERGKEEDALAAFDRGIELAPNPTTWNDVAWALAVKGTRLDVAEKHVRSAIDTATAALAGVTLDSLAAPHVRATDSLAAFWDTLGWVHFKRGDLEKARPWLEAAWHASENGEVAEHLAELHERLGRADRAVQLYAQAVAVSDRPASKAALDRLVKSAGMNLDAAMTGARSQLTEARTVLLASRIADTGTAEFFLSVESGRITGARFISGDEGLGASHARLVGTAVPLTSPDARPVHLIRRGVVSCTGAGCALVLVPTSLARTDELPLK